ncbi:MAG: hypothetical protein LBC23_03325 [Coriobacteriales bacterium]|jgi:hypothetical protein|nr:hypothetical protein [Coriobacteriales bacterium]
MTRVHWTSRRIRWAALATPVALCAFILMVGGLGASAGKAYLGRKAGA